MSPETLSLLLGIFFGGLGVATASIFGIVRLAKKMHSENQLLYGLIMVGLLLVALAGLASAGCVASLAAHKLT